MRVGCSQLTTTLLILKLASGLKDLPHWEKVTHNFWGRLAANWLEGKNEQPFCLKVGPSFWCLACYVPELSEESGKSKLQKKNKNTSLLGFSLVSSYFPHSFSPENTSQLITGIQIPISCMLPGNLA